MELTYVFASIVLLVLLISWGKVQPFLAFLVASSVAAILLGLPIDKVPGVLEKGVGNILGSLLGIVCIGAMFGKLVADSGAALIQPWVLIAGLGVALLSSVIPYSLDLEALRKIPPRVFGILMSLEPAMAALIGLAVLQESLRWSQWIAVLCVVAASAGATRGARPDV